MLLMKKETFQLICKKGKEGDPENYRLLSLTPDSRKSVQQILLEVISKHMNDKVTGNSYTGFPKDALCLSNMIASYQEMTGCAARGEQEIFFTFIK